VDYQDIFLSINFQRKLMKANPPSVERNGNFVKSLNIAAAYNLAAGDRVFIVSSGNKE
jgi:hypothetical protein